MMRHLLQVLALCASALSATGIPYSLNEAPEDLLPTDGNSNNRGVPEAAARGAAFGNSAPRAAAMGYLDGTLMRKFSHGPTHPRLLEDLPALSEVLRGTPTFSRPPQLGSVAPVLPLPLPEVLSVDRASNVHGLLRQALYARGMTRPDVDDLMVELIQKLSQGFYYPAAESSDRVTGHSPVAADETHPAPPSRSSYNKRANLGRRFFVHTRYSPLKLGTKLVPNQKTGDSGVTLLRYGRSAGSAPHDSS